jgi:BTB/POZ domain-containing protein 1/2
MCVLYASKKYNVLSLEKECVGYLRRNLRVDNAFMLLTQARLFDESELAESCLELIDKYALEVFSNENFYDIDLDLLTSIVKRDTLGIKESKLFQFLIRWSQAQCKKQNLPLTRDNNTKLLGNLVCFIRFPVMTKEEFALVMNSNESRIISDDQIIDLFLNFTLNNPKRHVDFIDRPRCCLGGREQVVNRFTQVESRWGYSGTSDRLKFSVDKRIIIVGLGLYGSIYGKCEYQVLIQLIHFDSCATLAQNNTSFTCDGTNSTFRVLFKEPVEIESSKLNCCLLVFEIQNRFILIKILTTYWLLLLKVQIHIMVLRVLELFIMKIHLVLELHFIFSMQVVIIMVLVWKMDNCLKSYFCIHVIHDLFFLI